MVLSGRLLVRRIVVSVRLLIMIVVRCIAWVSRLPFVGLLFTVGCGRILSLMLRIRRLCVLIVVVSRWR